MGYRMDGESRSKQLERVRAYCARPATAVLWDEAEGVLMDVFSAKTLPLRPSHLQSVTERVNAQTKNPYLVLGYDDGRELALSEVGIAFSPEQSSTGPLPDLPSVVCFRDYASLLSRLKHELYGHPGLPASRGTVQLLMMCIAISEGARARGFDISREERELEVHLKELEKHAPQP
jgi:hypothetical protein